jgi:ribonuclease HI
MNNNLPDSLPLIGDLVKRSEILDSDTASDSLSPSKGKAIEAARETVAETLHGILSAFSKKRNEEANEKSSSAEKKPTGKVEDFSSYDHLILSDGSVDSTTGAMGVGIQVLQKGAVIKSYSLRLQNSKGEDYCGTSPVAELVGLIYALHLSALLSAKSAVGTDSKNSVQWVTGDYGVNEPHIAQLVAYALHWKKKANDPDILEVARDKTAGVDDLARQAIGKGDRPERIKLTVRQFQEILKGAKVSNVDALLAPQSIYLEAEALSEFLKTQGVADDAAKKVVAKITALNGAE